MKTRPKIKLGDIVKWNKKVSQTSIFCSDEDTFIVTNIIGDGIDGYSEIELKKKDDYLHYSALRKELWYTGMNIKDYNKMQKTSNHTGNSSAYQREQLIDNVINTANKVYDEINTNKTNDGNEFCFKCGMKTKEVETGFVKKYNICPKCKI